MKINLFKNNLSLGDTYGVQTGDYVGELWTFIRSEGDDYEFLSMPKNVNRKIPKNKFDFGLKENIIEFVEKVPKTVRRVIKAQFEENQKG